MDLASRVARLTSGQRECLDLVDDHATSKEIARQLGISRHTVDARLRGAIQTLGVRSRREAAIIFRAAIQAEGYQPFAYQPPRIVPDPGSADNGKHGYRDISSGHSDESRRNPALDEFEDASQRTFVGAPALHGSPNGGPAVVAPHQSPLARHLELAEAGTVSDSAVWTAVGAANYSPQASSLRLWGGANDLSPAQRVAGILVVTILAMLAFGIFLSGIEALTLLRS